VDDVALLAFTSGTTGRPKATMHLHRDLLAVTDTFSAHVLRPGHDDLFAGSPPLAFTYGLGALLLFPLRVGAASLLLEQATPEALAGAVGEFGATVLSTSPTGYRMMLAAGAADRLSGLRRCVSAGEPLPRSVWQAVHDATGQRVVDGIGSTELLHVFISAAGDDIRPGSTGRPVPGYRAAVLDDGGRPVPDGTVGRLAVRGPTGCRYLADPRQTSYVQGGWNVTGDAYLRDPDGYYWYQARTDDMIISAGYNIAGPEVEEALLGHPDVVDCGVVAAPDADRGMVVKAYVVLRDGPPAGPAAAARTAELQEFVKQRIAPYKYPRSVAFATALPRTNTGKLQRFRLREQASAEAAAPAAAPS
jgi:2-aminobenzoate-CoA ligase